MWDTINRERRGVQPQREGMVLPPLAVRMPQNTGQNRNCSEEKPTNTFRWKILRQWCLICSAHWCPNREWCIYSSSPLCFFSTFPHKWRCIKLKKRAGSHDSLAWITTTQVRRWSRYAEQKGRGQGEVILSGALLLPLFLQLAEMEYGVLALSRSFHGQWCVNKPLIHENSRANCDNYSQSPQSMFTKQGREIHPMVCSV